MRFIIVDTNKGKFAINGEFYDEINTIDDFVYWYEHSGCLETTVDFDEEVTFKSVEIADLTESDFVCSLSETWYFFNDINVIKENSSYNPECMIGDLHCELLCNDSLYYCLEYHNK